MESEAKANHYDWVAGPFRVWKACIPFMIMAVFLLGRRYCKWRMQQHAEDPMKVKLYGEYLAGVTILCVFLSTLMHPSVCALRSVPYIAVHLACDVPGTRIPAHVLFGF